jgi:hypothetical protein
MEGKHDFKTWLGSEARQKSFAPLQKEAPLLGVNKNCVLA